MTNQDKLLKAKGRFIAEQIVEGATAEESERRWKSGGEALALAKLHTEGELEPRPAQKKISEMTLAEKTALRNDIGDQAFAQRIREARA